LTSASICLSNRENGYVSHVRFCDVSSAFLLELAYLWRNHDLDFQDKRTYGIGSAVEKDEMIRVSLAVLEAGQVRFKMDESMVPEFLYEIRPPIVWKLKRKQVEKMRDLPRRWRN